MIARVAAVAVAALLVGCPDPDPPGDDCADDAAWTLALDDDGGPVLAVDNTGAWLVGGGPGGGGARAVHVEDGALVPVELDRPEALWWAWTSPTGTTWLVGEGGLVLRGDATGLDVVPSGTTHTLYGVWGHAMPDAGGGADDVWIVGGRPGAPDDAGAGDDAIVLRWDGAALVPVALPAAGAALFKVWGAPEGGDVWLTGEAGAVWRWRDGAFEDHALPTAASVLTVHGCTANEVYAVAGTHVWQWDGAAWLDLPDLPSFAMATGVACGAREVLVVGVQGVRLRRDRATGAWTDDTLDPFVATDLHGAHAAADGTLWAVGGDYLAPGATVRRGVVARRACAAASTSRTLDPP